MVLKGDAEYTLHFNESDVLSDSQRNYATAQLALFETWYAEWNKQFAGAQKHAA
jgi:4-hydroxy-tetrahydrodipicolinate synthase